MPTTSWAQVNFPTTLNRPLVVFPSHPSFRHSKFDTSTKDLFNLPEKSNLFGALHNFAPSRKRWTGTGQMENSSRQVPLDPSQVSPPSPTKNAVCPSVIRHENGIENTNNSYRATERTLFGQADIKKQGRHGAQKAEILAAHNCQNVRPAENECHDRHRSNAHLTVISNGLDDERTGYITEMDVPRAWPISQPHSLVPLRDVAEEESMALLQPQQTSHEVNSATDPILLSAILKSFPLPQSGLPGSPQECSTNEAVDTAGGSGLDRKRSSRELSDVHQQVATELILSSQLHYNQVDKHIEAKVQHIPTLQAGGKSALEQPEGVELDDDENLSNRETDRADCVCEFMKEEPLQENKAANVRYACPFYKHDEQKYRSERSCVGPGWHSIQRVKEHIIRKHTSAEFECNRCRAQFRTEPQLKRHARKPCQYRSKSLRCETIDQSKILQLKSRKGKAKSEEEKWYEMYKILFPSVEKFPSPYFEAELDAPMEGFRTKLFGEGLLGEVLRKRLREKLNSCFLKVESSVLTRIEDAVESALRDTLQDAQGTERKFSRIKTCSYPPPSREPSIFSDERIYPGGLQDDSFESDCLGRSNEFETAPLDVCWDGFFLGLDWGVLDSTI